MSLFIARSSAIAARALDEEMIVMSVGDSSLFTLNEVAACIWRAADGRTSLTDLVQNHVCSEFDVDPETAYADAEDLCRRLAQHGILILSEQPIAPVEQSTAPPSPSE